MKNSEDFQTSKDVLFPYQNLWLLIVLSNTYTKFKQNRNQGIEILMSILLGLRPKM